MADESGSHIIVTTSGGAEICRVRKEDVTTALDLKNCIETQEGTAVAQQRLLGSGGVLADEQPMPLDAEEDTFVTLVRVPPSKEVFIQGGQGGYVSVDDDGNVKPGLAFRWHMAEVAPDEFTFQAAEGPHEGQYISALHGEVYGEASLLKVTGYADSWAVDTRGPEVFYDWARCGPFSMGIRDATRTVDFNGKTGLNAFWRWQSNHFHLAAKEGIAFEGDEAFYIGLAEDPASAAIQDRRSDASAA